MFENANPVVVKIVGGAGLVLVLIVLATIWQRVSAARESRRRRAQVRHTQSILAAEHKETQRRAEQIITTSSTGSISGFEVVRQVEAVFSDGHKTLALAVEAVKAIAARKGANAIVNLASERLPTGACAARGDAVIVRSLEPPGAARTECEPEREPEQ
ncbi:MAG: hypothetical protein JXO22_10825 [Phycisphaerae bacterium]|nr:hypothetical protein [Phycisphaerae bacterium]